MALPSPPYPGVARIRAQVARLVSDLVDHLSGRETKSAYHWGGNVADQPGSPAGIHMEMGQVSMTNVTLDVTIDLLGAVNRVFDDAPITEEDPHE